MLFKNCLEHVLLKLYRFDYIIIPVNKNSYPINSVCFRFIICIILARVNDRVKWLVNKTCEPVVKN